MRKIKTLKQLGGKLVVVPTVLILLVATTNAYTVVMRGGRRVEVPSTFVLTASTLTYEVSAGVQITLPVATIDIPATEKANSEQPGSFWQRVGKRGESVQSDDVRSANQPRTITNRDLESVAKRRRDSEQAYEVRRKQLQLPSVEESRRRAAEESAAIALELEQRRLAQSETEQYWRERAATLRTEMAAVDAEIAFVRSKLEEGWPASGGAWSSDSFTNTFGVVPGFPSIGYGRSPFGNRFRRFPGAGRHRQNVYVAPRRGAFGGHSNFGAVESRARVFHSDSRAMVSRLAWADFPRFQTLA